MPFAAVTPSPSIRGPESNRDFTASAESQEAMDERRKSQRTTLKLISPCTSKPNGRPIEAHRTLLRLGIQLDTQEWACVEGNHAVPAGVHGEGARGGPARMHGGVGGVCEEFCEAVAHLGEDVEAGAECVAIERARHPVVVELQQAN